MLCKHCAGKEGQNLCLVGRPERRSKNCGEGARMQSKAKARAIPAEATGVDAKVGAMVIPGEGSGNRGTSHREAVPDHGPQTDLW